MRRPGTQISATRLAASWLPGAAGLAYIVVLAASLRDVLGQLGWDADALSPMLIADSLARGARGQVLVGHMGYYPMVAFDVATAWLPFHRQLWILFPFALSVAGVALLAWMAWRLAGAWAAGLTSALAISASPTVLLSLAAQGYRAATLFCTILLAALLLLMLRHGPRRPGLVLAAGSVAVVAGVALASDTFLAVWGLVPFVVAALFVAAIAPGRKHVEVLVASVLVVIACGICSYATARLAHHFGFRLLPVDNHLANADQVLANGRLLLTDLRILFSGPFDMPAVAGEAISWGFAALGLAATALGLVMVLRSVRRRGLDDVQAHRLGVVVFWATSAVAVAGAFLVSTFAVDTQSTRYLLTVFFGAAVVAPLWAATVGRRRVAVGLVTGVFCVASAVALRTSVSHHLFQPSHTIDLPTAVSALEARGVHRGYSTYWDANAITWKTDGKLQLIPIVVTGQDTRRFITNLDTSWYEPAPATPTFVLVDPAVPFVDTIPGAGIGRPTATETVGRFTIAYYEDDIAGRLGPP